MTFEEFKELALNPPYIEQASVYRVDVHCYIKPSEGWDATETRFEVQCTQSFVFSDLSSARCKLKEVIGDKELKERLYAVYTYQLPFGKDISNDLYQRLWVYDRLGNLNGQSCCTSIIEDLAHISAKFRGHEAKSIRFNPGDIVEVYDRERGVVRLATVIKCPMTVEQCWEERKHVEISCNVENISAEFVDANYWLYADNDCYLAVDGPDFESNRLHPRIYDVFTPAHPISSELRQHFAEYYRFAMESVNKMNDNWQKFMDKILSLAELL